MAFSRAAKRGRGRRVVSGFVAVLVALGLVTGSANAATAGGESDPWQKMNRGIFWFNERADIYLIAPVAAGWRWITPSFFRTAVTHFNDNLAMPVVLANNVLQLRPANAGHDFLRIVFNYTFGIAGLIDVATMVEIPENDEDFGQTLGYWGVPTGPYLVLPLFGPSNIRDGFGRLADAGGTFYFSFLPFWSTFIVRGVEIVNWRSDYLEEVEENRRESFDYYVFLRNAYLQNRRAKVGRRVAESGEGSAHDEDLYFFFDDDDDDDEEQGDELDGDDE